MSSVMLSLLARFFSSKVLSTLSLAVRPSLSLLNRRRERDGIKRVAIFDKDGTLIDIHSQWAPWIRKLVSSIETETNLDISATAFSKLAFDDEAGRVLPGTLGEGTIEMIKDCLSSIVQEESMIPRWEADCVVEACLRACSSMKSGEVRPIGDAASMFQRLRRRGFLIAINTSDSRDVTLQTLQQLGISELVDTVVCGDDDWMIAKPHPVSANTICTRLGVQPENAIMVGDSPCDVQLGTNAELGCSIGVLTGIAPREDLEAHAHVVVPNVMEAAELILSGTEKRSSPRTVATACSHQNVVFMSSTV